MLMKKKEKISERGRKPLAWPWGRQQQPGGVTGKDVKNEDRSGDMYENKGTHDTLTEEKSDFVSENATLSQIFATFDGQFRLHIQFPRHENRCPPLSPILVVPNPRGCWSGRQVQTIRRSQRRGAHVCLASHCFGLRLGVCYHPD
jgi:hypothetical protein